MGREQKSFILYKSYLKHFEMLTDEQLGKLIRAVFVYTETEEIPDLEPLLKMAFGFMKDHIDINADKWERRAEASREAGKLGGRPLKEEEPNETSNNLEKPSRLISKPRKPVNVNGNVNVDANVVVDGDVDVKKLSGYSELIEHINSTLNRSYRGDIKSKGHFKARMKEGYKLEEIKQAITSASRDRFHIENGFKYLTPEYILRADKLEKWLNTDVKASYVRF